MTENERAALVARQSPTIQKIDAAMAAAPGEMMTAPALREPTGRADGMSVELQRMMMFGLIEPAGKERRPVGMDVQQYTRVPAGRAEEAAQRYLARRRKHPKRRAKAARIADLRELAEGGSYSNWYQTRKHALRLTRLLNQIDAMTFWQNAPTHELERALEEFLDLQETVERVIVSIHQRSLDDATRAKIEKLMETNGRTEHEAATARTLATKLRKKL